MLVLLSLLVTTAVGPPVGVVWHLRNLGENCDDACDHAWEKIATMRVFLGLGMIMPFAGGQPSSLRSERSILGRLRPGPAATVSV